MFASVRRRARLAAVIGVCAAGILAAAAAGAGPAAARPQAQAIKVPWASVGPGWTLAQFANGPVPQHATTLYLISPADAKYSLYTWPASKVSPPGLIAWSGDKTRALLYGGSQGAVVQLNLKTGKLSRFTLAGKASAIGYTRPDGLNILGISESSTGVWTLARYGLTGARTKVLVSGTLDFTGLYSADGTTLAVPASNGVWLVSNAGTVLKKLPVPGTDTKIGCTPMRWWTAHTILAQCTAGPYFLPRLWLVPAGGGKPAALTRPRTPKGPDLGDIDAWQLTSGTFLQSEGACGALEINRQARDGTIKPVDVPGTPNTENEIVSAAGPRLLIDVRNSCFGGGSLLWFNPGTHAETWLLKGSAKAFLIAVPFNSTENAPAF